jgi:hypothetical protein
MSGADFEHVSFVPFGFDKGEHKEQIDEIPSSSRELVTLLEKYRIEVVEFRQERKKFLDMQEKINKFLLHNDEIIRLDIGGKIFATTAEVLKRETPTFFSAMFSEYWHKKPSDGVYFIDRDPTYFGYIMSYFRNPEMENPFMGLNLMQLQLLEIEVEFYQITSLMEKLKPVINELVKLRYPSTIISIEDANLVRSWIGKNTDWKLLYRGSTDGFGSSNFHAQCDNRGPTVTIIKTTNGSVFGGYAAGSWSSSGQYQSHGLKNFIFSFVRFIALLATPSLLLKQQVKLENDGPDVKNQYGIVGEVY